MTYFYGVSCHNLEMFKGNQCLHSETTQYTFTEHSHSLLWSILHKIMTYFFIEEGTVVPRERKKKGYSHVSQAIFKRMRKKKKLWLLKMKSTTFGFFKISFHIGKSEKTRYHESFETLTQMSWSIITPLQISFELCCKIMSVAKYHNMKNISNYLKKHRKDYLKMESLLIL